MKVVVQRVQRASVTVDGKIIGKIGRGLMLLIGIAESDTIFDIDFIADKCVNLRIFEDEYGKMNRSVLEENGEILAISQFTLLGNTKKGRRPSFIDAANPGKGESLYNEFVKKLQDSGLKIETGIFGAMMDVDLLNYGPVTLIVESKV
ncbi:MAG: D-aminoacyl-tRNA deacylase [Calditrichaceae bacterium]|jgi:D-aminoacyl-tRNA deacylase